MVNLALGRSNKSVLDVALNLSQRFQASVIGVAGGHADQLVLADGYASEDVYELQDHEVAKMLAETHAEFRRVFESKPNRIEWRVTDRLGSVDEFVAKQSRGANLLISAAHASEFFDSAHSADTGNLLLSAGRPVLVVPDGVSPPVFNWVLIAWKDTPEARRAVYDAIPILQLARHVAVVEIFGNEQGDAAKQNVDDVVAWLAHHGVRAHSMPLASIHDEVGQLGRIATEHGADLVVAGGYGHSPARERIFGGTTRDLLANKVRCSLLSH